MTALPPPPPTLSLIVKAQSKRIVELEQWIEEFRRYLANDERATELQKKAEALLNYQPVDSTNKGANYQQVDSTNKRS